MTTSFLKTFGAAMALLLLLGAGCAASKNVPPVTSDISGARLNTANIPNGEFSGTGSPQVTQWAQYKSTDLGLTIQYPPDWAATSTDLSSYGQSVAFFQTKDAPIPDGSYGYKQPWPFFSVHAYPPPKGQTTGSVLREKELGRDIDPGYDTLLEVGTVKVGGYKYLERIIGGEREGLREYWITHNGRNYVFNMFDPSYKPLCSQNNTCLKMLQSVKFTD